MLNIILNYDEAIGFVDHLNKEIDKLEKIKYNILEKISGKGDLFIETSIKLSILKDANIFEKQEKEIEVIKKVFNIEFDKIIKSFNNEPFSIAQIKFKLHEVGINKSYISIYDKILNYKDKGILRISKNKNTRQISIVLRKKVNYSPKK